MKLLAIIIFFKIYLTFFPYISVFGTEQPANGVENYCLKFMYSTRTAGIVDTVESSKFVALNFRELIKFYRFVGT